MARQTLRNADTSELGHIYGSLVNGLKARGVDHHDAEDQTAEAMCKGLDVENLINVMAWLVCTAANGAKTLGRKEKTAAAHRQALGYHGALIREGAAVDPAAEAMRREEIEILRKTMAEALATLSALDRAILTRRVVGGSTNDQLAKRFDLTKAAIKGRLQRAKERLRQFLEPRLHGPCGKAA